MATPPHAIKTSANPWLVLVFLSLGFFMILLDTTIVNIAIPSIIPALHSSLDQILWVLNAYLLVYAVLLITFGRLGDIVGPRLLFIIGLIIFTAASALCGLAQDGNQLIAARVLQGLGGAILTPQTLGIITLIFPPDRRGGAFGIWEPRPAWPPWPVPPSGACSLPTLTSAGSSTSTSPWASLRCWARSSSSLICGPAAGIASTSPA
jgi:MFS family permease